MPRRCNTSNPPWSWKLAVQIRATLVHSDRFNWCWVYLKIYPETLTLDRCWVYLKIYPETLTLDRCWVYLKIYPETLTLPVLSISENVTWNSNSRLVLSISENIAWNSNSRLSNPIISATRLNYQTNIKTILQIWNIHIYGYTNTHFKHASHLLYAYKHPINTNCDVPIK